MHLLKTWLKLSRFSVRLRRNYGIYWPKIGKFRNSRRANAPGSTNFEAINEAMVNFEVENANIHKNYYLKLKKVVSTEVINKLLRAEKEYQES